MPELQVNVVLPYYLRLAAGDYQTDYVGGVLRVAAPLEYEAAGPQPAVLTREQTTRAIRDGLASGNDPDVADLFLLDAERALHEGRFRESVLFSWSTIDSVFNRRYNELVDTALLGEWSEARDFFKGLDFKLRNKMSAGMHLVAHRSLFREPGDFWQRLSASYTKRNAIIHRGENANEDEATQAVAVARQMIQIMHEV